MKSHPIGIAIGSEQRMRQAVEEQVRQAHQRELELFWTSLWPDPVLKPERPSLGRRLLAAAVSSDGSAFKKSDPRNRFFTSGVIVGKDRLAARANAKANKAPTTSHSISNGNNMLYI